MQTTLMSLHLRFDPANESRLGQIINIIIHAVAVLSMHLYLLLQISAETVWIISLI